MKGLVSRKMRFVILSVSLIVVFGLLISGNEAQAQDNLKFVTLFQGQQATVNFSQTTPFGISSVAFTSIGNRTMRAVFQGSGNVQGDQRDPSGFWLMTLFGTGGKNYFGAAGGFVPLGAGQEALIDVGQQLSFGVATASVFLTSLGDDAVYNYGIRVQP